MSRLYNRSLIAVVGFLSCIFISVNANAEPNLFPTGGGQAYDNMQPSLGLTYAIATTGLFPSRNLTDGDPDAGNLSGSGDQILGGVGIIGTNFAPRGWLPADGQLLPINQYQALFSILGTTYGGDGRTDFALPDLRGRVPIHRGAGPGLPTYQLGQKSGTETSTMTIPEMPNHRHSSVKEPTGFTGLTGGGLPENNMQPYLALNYIIALQGQFPSRSLTDGDPGSGNLSGSPLIGGVSMFAGNFAPRGWAFAQGQTLDIASHTALFSILGTTYGGDGRTTFKLPDLRGRTPIGPRTGPGLTTRSLGEVLGEHETTLTLNEMPEHFHTLDTGVNVGNEGGGQSHNNMAPSLGLNYVVALQGTFPSRNLTDGDPDSGNLSANPMLGSVSLFAGNFAPRGWAFADGQLLPINGNEALFSLFGTNYGGDGRTSFGLPDLRGRAAMHWGTGAGLSPRQLGQRVGAEDTTLTVLNLANHTHSITIPEPSSLVLVALGLMTLGLIRLRRKQA